MTSSPPTVPGTLLGKASLALLLDRPAAADTPRQEDARQGIPHQAGPGEPTVEVPYRTAIVAATDGSCRGNPGPGGWSWYIDGEQWASGGETLTTNNIMELMAVKEVLQATRHRSVEPLHLKVDSKYVIESLTKWVHGWKRNGWKTGAGKPVANQELIQAISELLEGRDVRFEWVKGHAGNHLNEGADVRACAAADGAKGGSPGRCGPGLAG